MACRVTILVMLVVLSGCVNIDCNCPECPSEAAWHDDGEFKYFFKETATDPDIMEYRLESYCDHDPPLEPLLPYHLSRQDIIDSVNAYRVEIEFVYPIVYEPNYIIVEYLGGL